MAADETVEPLKELGANQHNSPKEDGCAIGTPSTHGSNQAETIVRKLKRDHPEIAAALANGEYPSARAAGIAAGIVRVSTPLDVMKRAWPARRWKW